MAGVFVGLVLGVLAFAVGMITLTLHGPGAVNWGAVSVGMATGALLVWLGLWAADQID